VLEQLRHTLHLLAAPPEQTLDWLRLESAKVGDGVVLGIDEIALDFENWARACWQLLETGDLTQSAHQSILALNISIEQIGNDPADWTPSAFAASEKWRQIRTEAARILKQLGSDI